MKKNLHLLIVNQPFNNRGDEAAHRALIRSLVNSLSSASITVLFTGTEQKSIDQLIVTHPNVRYLNIWPKAGYGRIAIPVVKAQRYFFLWKLHPTTRRILEEYRKADYVICAPGGICMGGFQNWNHLLMLSYAKFSNKPVLYFGRSIGPFPVVSEDNRLFKEISLNLLKYCSFISLRDKRSQDIARSLNINDFDCTIDSAFLNSTQSSIPVEVSSKLSKQPYIVFVPNSLIWHFAFKEDLTEEDIMSFYSHMLDIIIDKYPNHKVVLLPQTYGFKDGDIGGDAYFFNKFCQYYKGENSKLLIIDDCYNCDIQQAIINHSDLMIGARYHSIVFAINQEVPFVALSYEHKISGLLSLLGAEDYLIDISRPSSLKENSEQTLLAFRDRLIRAKSVAQLHHKAESIVEESYKKMLKLISK